MGLIANYYARDGTFINSRDDMQIPQLGARIIIENPSGLVFTGIVGEITIDFRFDDETAVILDGKWEWE